MAADSGIVMLSEAISFVLIFWTHPEAYWLSQDALVQFVSTLPTFLVVVHSLLCAAILSGDLAYLLVRLEVTEEDVWAESSRPRWAFAWLATWVLQLPFWMRVLPATSPLLVYEAVNLVLTTHHLLLWFAGDAAPAFPSAMLATRKGLSLADFVFVVVGRTGLPLLFLSSRGLPAEWRCILAVFLLNFIPNVVVSALSLFGLASGREGADLPWELQYAPGTSQCEVSSSDDECEVHGVCPICLGNLCAAGGLGALAGPALLRRTVGPGLAVLRRGGAQAASMSAVRISADWGDNRIAVTRCGHTFHNKCLGLAAESFPRCPQCRTSFPTSSLGHELPDEDTLDEQQLCLSFGLLIGAFLLIFLWLFWASGLKEVEQHSIDVAWRAKLARNISDQ